MKKFFASLFVCAVSWTVAVADNFVITGNVTAVPDSTIVELAQMDGKSGIGIASDTVINGQFRLSAPLDCDLAKTYLTLAHKDEVSPYRVLYLRPNAQIEINADDNFVGTWQVKSNVPEQADYDRFITKSKALLDTVQKQSSDFVLAMHRAPDNAVRGAVMASFEAGKSYRDSLDLVIKFNDIEILQQSPVTTVWLDKLESLAGGYGFFENYSDKLVKSLRNLYNNLDDKDKSSKQGTRIQILLYPPTKIEVGDTVPDAVFTDIEGSAHTLSEMRGKWMLLDFWSGGCHMCILAMPELHEFAEKHIGEAEVISLSIDSDKSWRSATEFHQVKGNNWNEGMEDVGLYKKFGIEGLPVFVLISPEGIVKSKWLGFQPGQFEREFKLYSRPKNNPEYTALNGMRTVTYPKYSANATSAILDIESVKLSDSGTTIRFSVTFTPGWWISISPEAFLTTDNGTQLHLIGSDGITPGDQFYTDEKGSASFSLTFESLPADSEHISFFEGPNSEWSIKNIRIKP